MQEIRRGKWRQRRFAGLARAAQLDDEVAENIVLEALAAVYLVESLVKEARSLKNRIRRLGKSRDPLDQLDAMMLQGKWGELIGRGISLKGSLRRSGFGKHLPRTKSSISRKLSRTIGQKSPATDAFLPKYSANDHFQESLDGPGSKAVDAAVASSAALLKSNENPVKIDISASFWDDKMTVLQKFITEGKI